MNIPQNRVLRAFCASIGPLIITVGQFIQLRDKIYYPIILLLITILLFTFILLKTPRFYVQEKENGFLITGSKSGIYDPDYIEFDKITNIEKKGSNIEISLKDNSKIELNLPSKFIDSFIDYAKSKTH